jgi:hypothetical protein
VQAVPELLFALHPRRDCAASDDDVADGWRSCRQAQDVGRAIGAAVHGAEQAGVV